MKREEDYTKKLKDKNRIKDEAAYTSLAEYQQKRMKLGETFTTGFDVSLQKQGQDVEEEKEKSESPKRQTLLDISPASNRQIIEISTNKEKYNEDISFGNKTKNKRNLNNSSLNDSGDDSYSKEENDIIRKPNILLGK